MALGDPLINFDIGLRGENSFRGTEPINEFEVDDIFDFGLATVTDIFTSVVNSASNLANVVLPEQLEFGTLDTEEILRSFSEESADFFLQHRQGIQLASLLGGAFVPGLLVAKGLRAAKDGAFLLNSAGRPLRALDDIADRQKQKVFNLLEEGHASTLESQRAMRAFVGTSLARGATESAIFELGFVGLMNSHAFLEDYDYKDFLIGTAIGTVPSAGIRLALDARRFRQERRKIQYRHNVKALPFVAPTFLAVNDNGFKLGILAEHKKQMVDALGDSSLPIPTKDVIKQEQLKVDSQLSEVIRELLGKGKENKRLNPGPALPGRAKDIFAEGTEGHVMRLIEQEGIRGLQGVHSIRFWDGQSIGTFGPRYSAISGDELLSPHAGRTDLFEGGTLEDWAELLNQGSPPRRTEEEILKGLSDTEKSQLASVLDDTTSIREIDFKIRSTGMGGYKVNFDNPGAASILADPKSELSKFFRAFVDQRRLLDSSQDTLLEFEFRGDASKLQDFMQSRENLAFQRSRVRKVVRKQKLDEENITPSQLYGSRAPGNQLFRAGNIVVRDLNDLPPQISSVEILELGNTSNVASRKELRRLTDAEDNAFQFLDGDGRINPLSNESRNFLRTQGFDAVEVIGNRRNRTPAFQILKEDNLRKLRDADVQGILDDAQFELFNRQAAIYDPVLGRILPAAEAFVVKRAVDKNPRFAGERGYDFSEASITTRSYNPETNSVANIDGRILTALKAKLPRQTPTIPFDDLPRLEALHLRNRSANVELSLTQKKLLEGDALRDHVRNTKVFWTRELVNKGNGIEQIARYTNTPVDTVEKIIASGFDRKLLESDSSELVWSTYSDATRVQDYLRPKQLQLQGATELERSRFNMQRLHKIDAEVNKDIANSIADTVSASFFRQPLIASLHELWKSPTFREVADNTAHFGNQNIGNRGFLSVDAALRDVPGGQAAAQIGQNFNRAVSQHIDAVSARLQPALQSISREGSGSIVLFDSIRRALQNLPAQFGKSVRYNTESRNFTYANPGSGDVEPLTFLSGGQTRELRVNSDAVHEYFSVVWPAEQQRLEDLTNVVRKLQGKDDVDFPGLWFPQSSLEDTHVAFAYRPDNVDQTKIISAHSAQELTEKLKQLPEGTEAVTRGEQKELFDQLRKYNESNFFRDVPEQIADVAAADDRILNSVLRNIEGHIWSGSRGYFRTVGDDTFREFEAFSQIYQNPTEAATGVTRLLGKKHDAAEIARATMLNESLVNDFPTFQAANNAFSWGINRALQTFRTHRQDFSRQLDQGHYQELLDDLEKLGVPNPYAGWEDFRSRAAPGLEKLDKNLIAETSSYMVMATLRAWEWAHAAVTTITTPVVLTAELRALNSVGEQTAQFPSKYMMRAAKRAFNRNDPFVRSGFEKGYTTRMTAEVTETLRKLQTEPSKLQKFEKSRLGKTLTFGSDQAEERTRELAYLTGVEVALDKFGRDSPIDLIETFANQFTLRTMGNYNSRQRPVFFQGSLGQTWGLYQTFILTMGQNMFRYMERGQKGALLQLAAGQTAAFGVSSLPGFDLLSTAIGEYANQDHEDLTSLAFKLFGSDPGTAQSGSAAEYLLFGFPSAFFQQALFTRGELEPRLPFTLGREGAGFAPPIVNAGIENAGILFQTAQQMGTVASNGGSLLDVGKTALQGASLQTLWRPGARISELILGQSFDRTGRVIGQEEDVRAPLAMLSRAIGTRDLKEQALRNVNFLGRYYDSVDASRRKRLIRSLRLLAAEESLSEDKMAQLFSGYLDNGGTGRGWRSAVNEALLSISDPLAARLADNHQKNPIINEILRSYLAE